MEQTRIGSTRIISSVEPGVIAFQYTDHWSAIDRGSSEQLIPGIGAARCACAVKSFRLAQQAGLPTHFVRQVDSLTIHVKEFSVPGRESLSGMVHGHMLIAEWIWRAYVYGSLLERIRKGIVKLSELGFGLNAVVEAGTMLPHILQECTTKFEPVDRHLSDEEARELTGLNRDQWRNAQDLVMRAVELTCEHFESKGFMSPDGKIELAITEEGEVVLVDVFGTQDENRIIHVRTGNIHSKDLIRNYLNSLPWKAELNAAKAAHPYDKSKWPLYPTLPDDLVELVSRRYTEVARAYAD